MKTWTSDIETLENHFGTQSFRSFLTTTSNKWDTLGSVGNLYNFDMNEVGAGYLEATEQSLLFVKDEAAQKTVNFCGNYPSWRVSLW